MHRESDAPRFARRWKCICDCGTEKITSQNSLRRGLTRSCGCLHREDAARIGRNRYTHGETRGNRQSTEYVSWLAMRNRCYKKSDVGYKNYGGRGIRVCSRWRNSFSNFLVDMGRKPSLKHSIERVDGRLGYTLKNCKWATPKEQTRNRRNTKLYKFRGKYLTASEWGFEVGLKPYLINNRVRSGWSVDTALTTPVRHKLPNGSGTRRDMLKRSK